jgi:hypothetical protein
MNKNPILNWDHTPPTEPGLYLCCYGDVEAPDYIKMVRCVACVDGRLMTIDGLRPEDYGPQYQWARLLVGSEAKRFVEGSDG